MRETAAAAEKTFPVIGRAATDGPRTAAVWTRAIVRALQTRGIDGTRLAIDVGIDPARVDRGDGWVSMRVNSALWRRAVAVAADPAFGLAVARHVGVAAFAPLGAAVWASMTLRAAFERIARYTQLICDGVTIHVEDGPRHVRLVLAVNGGATANDAAIDAAMALLLHAARCLRDDRELRPRHVELRRPPPVPPAAFERHFRAPIAFAAARNAMVFARPDVDAVLPSAHPELARSTEGVLERAVPPPSTALTDHLRAALGTRLATGTLAQDEVARRLGMSRRTLQRRLAAAGTSYGALLAETRMALAASYLADGWPVTDVALMVGFATPSSFSRAFRRHHGHPPSAARAKETAETPRPGWRPGGAGAGRI